jgi:type I restriction enzyme S subunit
MSYYPAYPAYKQSGCPEGWEQKRLRFEAFVNPSRTEIQLKEDDQVSFVPMETVGEYGGLKLYETKELSEVGGGYTYFRDNDVLIAKITPCFENGKGALAQGLVNGTAFGTTELHVLRAKSDSTNPAFLFYLTISQKFRKLGEGEMFGAGGQKRVPESFIKDYRVSLPTESEQETIVRFLDFKTTQIDALITKKQVLLGKLAEKRTSMINRAVTKGLDLSVPTKDSGASWLERIPQHWDAKRLRFLTTMSGGMTPSTSNPAFWDGDIPWITPKDMKREVLFASEDTLTEEALKETGITLYDAGKVLIVVRGMILAHTFPVAINAVNSTVNQDMKAISTVMNSEYLALLLRGIQPLILSLVEEAAHGTKVLRTDVFKNLMLPVPPLSEQALIVSRVSELTNALDSQGKTIQTLIDRLQEYRSAVITNAVTGRIDIRNVPIPLTDDLPASELEA